MGPDRSGRCSSPRIPVGLAVTASWPIPFRSAYRLLANEDGIAEWLQVVALVVLFVLYLRLVVQLWQSGQRLYAVLFLVARGRGVLHRRRGDLLGLA